MSITSRPYSKTGATNHERIFGKHKKCQKGKMLHVVFGYITNQMLEDAAAGRYALGGCLMPTSPVHRCNTCAASVGGDELAAIWRKSRS